MIDQATIEEAIRRVLAAAPQGSRVILFGSYARGDADERSDVDLLVIEPEVENHFEEMIRLRRVIGELLDAVDVIVVDAAAFDYWKDTRNTLPYTAAKEGRAYDRVA
jgi:predicted nucleotidyltransferase